MSFVTSVSELCGEEALRALITAVRSQERVKGLTHEFYKYPARFSPDFARAAIRAFTTTGDVVLDPFMGGGTTLVEATALGRRALGSDISELSCFVSRAKTLVLSDDDLDCVSRWLETNLTRTNLHLRNPRPLEWIDAGYQRNVNTRETWRIRKLIEILLHDLPALSAPRQRDFARAIVLRTAQWALDCRTKIPTVDLFRKQIGEYHSRMVVGAVDYRTAAGRARGRLIINRAAKDLDIDAIEKFGKPKLVVTSPPYPGVHVLYHRWQILGRKETPAPFWIANSNDGSGLSHYTFGDRKSPNLDAYFSHAEMNFRTIADACSQETIVVQLVAFSQPSVQLPRYLETMQRVGLREVAAPTEVCGSDGRLWRTVPNRRWYAKQGTSEAGNEVVLFHVLA